jgi:hypothetical protein
MRGEKLCTKTWESDWFNLTYASTNQYLKQILVHTAGDITVTVENNRGEQAFRVHGSTDIQKINLNLKGEMFRLKISSDAVSTDISDLAAVIGFY